MTTAEAEAQIRKIAGQLNSGEIGPEEADKRLQLVAEVSDITGKQGAKALGFKAVMTMLEWEQGRKRAEDAQS